MIYSEHQNGRSVAVSHTQPRDYQIIQINFSFEVAVLIKKFVWLNDDKIIWVPQSDHTLSNGLKLRSTLKTGIHGPQSWSPLFKAIWILGYTRSFFVILNPKKANQCRPGARWGSSTCNHCCLTSLCNDMVSFDGDTFDWESWKMFLFSIWKFIIGRSSNKDKL